MFILAFLLFTWVFTSFQSFRWGLVFLMMSLIIWEIGSRIFPQWKTKKLKNLIWIGIAFGLAIGSSLLFWWMGERQIASDFFAFRQEERTAPSFQKTVSTYQILEQNKEDRYLIQETLSQALYLLKTPQPLRVGQHYLI